MLEYDSIFNKIWENHDWYQWNVKYRNWRVPKEKNVFQDIERIKKLKWGTYAISAL